MKKNNSMFPFVVQGLAIGFPVTVVCMALIGGMNGVVKEMMVWMVASALFGLVSGVIFQTLNLHLIAATLLHCACCLLVAAGACTICGYGENFLQILLDVLPVFLLVYALIYGFIYFAMRREAKKINEALNQE